MPSKTDEIIAAFEELLKRRGTQKPTDRLGLERPVVSRDFENKPMAGWEKAASLIGAAVSPASTIASMVLAPPQEESLFDRAITGPDGKTYYPEVSQSAVPRMKKVQRRAIETLGKYPSKPDYLRNAGSSAYSEAAKTLGATVPRTAPSLRENYTGTTYRRRGGPEMDLTEYRMGDPVGRIRFDASGKVSHAGVLPSHQGMGIGKELYKKAAMLGRDIYELNSTSQDAAKARYAALQDLAKGKFPQKPVKMEGQQKRTVAAPGQSVEIRKPTDWNRLQYTTELRNLIDAYHAKEITPAGYQRARKLLDSGEYRDVSRAVRERAESEPSNMNRMLLELLDFTPK